ncbi:MAG: outer membrane protein transport protein, partial [Bacteroidetes bacterium]|nr:outer membrane protein transport protein [Bacteroidota bacterium]
KGLTLGVSYQPKIKVAKFDKYAGLFAEQGDFDIPSNWTAGLAYEFSKKWAVLADYKRINYTSVASVSNLFNPASTSPLGSNLGAGFGWKDINGYKVGVEFSGTKGWTLRGGYSHCDQPVQTSQTLFNILAPGVIQDHLTVGCSKKLGESKKSVHTAIVYGLPASVEGHNPMDNQMIKLKMNQLELELAFTF